VSNTPRKVIVTVVAVVVLVTGAAVGRHLIAGSAASLTKSSAPAESPGQLGGQVARARSGSTGAHSGLAAIPTTTSAAAGLPTSAASASGPAGAPAVPPSPTNGGALPTVPVFPITPQIVRTATLDLGVGKNALSSTMTNIAGLAAADGGYVESSSMSGGTARTSPLVGSIVIHVLEADFSDAMTTLSGYGKVTDQQIQGRDVTNQVATNAATIVILQDEVNLLEGKLSQATDINAFLQIQAQLFPVEEQLQQLQNQQAVLENSAALATITTNLSAPGAPLVSVPAPRPTANAATEAWRYLRHNSLAVLDGLAVGGGWALPVVVLLALVGWVGTRVARRRRHAVNPA